MAEMLGDARKQALKAILSRLHAGESPAQLRVAFREAIGNITPVEIAQIEEELVAEGLPREELMRLCDLHLALFEESLAGDVLPVPEWHPLHILMAEHREVLQMANRLAALARMGVATDQQRSEAADLVHHLVASESHYVREENVLFPHLERYGVAEPPRVMWAEHDRIRGLKKGVVAALESGQGLAESAVALSEMLASHFTKENRILFPTAMRVIPEAEWPGIRAQFDELGYCCFTPLVPPSPAVGELTPLRDALADHQAGPLGGGAQSGAGGAAVRGVAAPELAVPPPGRPAAPELGAGADVSQAAPGQPSAEQVTSTLPAPGPSGAAPAPPPGVLVRFATGELTPLELQSMLDSLPIDITFVDKDDRVRYFSQGRERIFVRMPAVIGRRVQDCHPPKSLHVVERIISDFRAGRRDVAEFWIWFEGKLVHIRYFPVRSPEGEYLGVLEVTQDITRLRQLEGEKRLLDDLPPDMGSALVS